MSTPESERLTYPQGGDGAVTAAHAEHEARLAADEAQLRLPPSEQPHGQEVLSHHEGRPTVAEQMVTHRAAPPKVPDTGGRQSASDPIG
jgi:hypothetical protein